MVEMVEMEEIRYESINTKQNDDEHETEGKNEEQAIEPVGTVETAPEEVDGGYGWVVVAASFFVHVFVLGNIYSFGIFYPVYVKEFDSNQSSIAWVGSIGIALMVGMGVWSGKLADYYGNQIIIFCGAVLVGIGFLLGSFSTEVWHLYLTQGFIAGVGYSLAFIAGVSVVGQWFTKMRGLAVGIAVAGSGLGQFALSIITGKLITKFGWPGALRIIALIVFVGLSICALVIRRRLPLHTNATKRESSWDYFKDRTFTLLFIGSFVNSLGMSMPFTYIPIYAEKEGVSSTDAIFILSISGISSALGRIFSGYLADKVGKLFMLELCMLGGGISTLCWMSCKDFSSILVYALFYGSFAGGIISLMPSVVAELYGIKSLASILGLLYSSTAVGNLLSAPIGGFLYDATRNYTASISVAGGFLLSGLFFVMLIHAVRTPSPTTLAPKDIEAKGPEQLQLPSEDSVVAIPAPNSYNAVSMVELDQKI